jgi:rRNA small subunit pseudouridine methyltransferase Nep1
MDTFETEEKEIEMNVPKSGLKTEAPRIPKNFEERENWKRLIVILEQANLDITKNKKGQVELINCDDHQRLIKGMGKRLEDFRPDVTHQCLLSLLDSPLNKAGMLQVFIRSNKNVLIEIHPSIRIPRTFKRFSGLMAQLLSKYKVKAEGSEASATLMKVIKSSFEKVLPLNVKRIGTSSMAKLVDVQEYVEDLVLKEDDRPTVFIVGAVSIGNPGMEIEGLDDCICISNYSLSAACACGKIVQAFETEWGVL